MGTRNQVLECRKCGKTGSFEYERIHDPFEDHVRFISLSSGFTYREGTEPGSPRITCQCGEVVHEPGKPAMRTMPAASQLASAGGDRK